MKAILDTGAILAYLTDAPGAGAIDELLADGANVCLVHPVNASEAFGLAITSAGAARALAAMDALAAAGIEVRDDPDAALWLDAGRIQAALKLDIASCYAAALARKEQAILLTTRDELQAAAGAGICSVRPLRQAEAL